MRRVIVLHPFLFVIFSILFLYVHNISESTFSDLTLPMGLFLSLTFLALLSLKLILKNVHKAAIIVTTGLVFFFSYGHLFALVYEKYSFVHHYHAVPLEFLGFLTISYFVIKTRKYLQPLSRFLNVTTAILIGLSIFNITAYKLQASKLRTAESDQLPTEEGAAPLTTTENLPDVYYIILDGYANAVTLKRYYDYDNSAFIEFLHKKGFYVAEESFSNYPYTQFSLASSLNMRYINDSFDGSVKQEVRGEAMRNSIRNNRVSTFLKEQGYKYILIKSGWGPTDKNRYADLTLGGVYSEFVKMLVHTSMLRAIEGRLFFSEWHRDNIIQQFDHLENVYQIKGSKFILCHFVIPHPPFVFGPNGEPINVPDHSLGQNIWVPRERYMGQLNYTNMMVKKAITEILENSPEPPVIILQGDHGSTSVNEWDDPSDVFLFERMMILNSFYLPGDDYNQLYSSISPVNSFRYVFNRYFGTDHELLEDVTWYSPRSNPYAFEDVTGRVMKVLRQGESSDQVRK